MNNKLKIGGLYVLNIEPESYGFYLYETTELTKLIPSILKVHSKFIVLDKEYYSKIKVLTSDGYIGWTIVANHEVDIATEHDKVCTLCSKRV